MSTYTDLHTRRRENLTILRLPGNPDDGITPQRVILANPENIYEGTFKGTINAKDTIFNNVSCYNSLFDGVVLKNARIKIGENEELDIPTLTSNVSEMQQQISTLQNQASNLEASCINLDQDVSYLSNEIQNMSSVVGSEITSIESQLSNGMRYFGTIAEPLSSPQLFNNFMQAFNKQDIPQVLKKGFMIRIGGFVSIDDGNGNSHEFGQNDYIIVNKDEVALSDIQLSDVDIIRDAQFEGEQLSIELCEKIGYVSSCVDILRNETMQCSADAISIANDYTNHTADQLTQHINTKFDISAANEMSNTICANVVDSGYLKATSVDFEYIKSDENPAIVLSVGDKVLSIDAKDFIVDGMLSDVQYKISGDEEHTDPPYLVLYFNADAHDEPIWVSLKNLIDVYEAAGDGIELSNGNIFYLDYGAIRSSTGLNALCADLFGDAQAKGIIPTMQDQISAISVDEFGTLFFTGHLTIDNVSASYDSISAFFIATLGEDPPVPMTVKNGSVYNLVFKQPSPFNVTEIGLGDGSILSVGPNDAFIIHDHSIARYIDLSALKYASTSDGNAYLLRSGISRFELENEIVARKSGDDALSAWLSDNFDSDDNNIVLKKNAEVLGDLSINNNTYVLSDLNVVGSLFVNGNQLGISQKEISGETINVTETIANEISFSIDDLSGSIEQTPSISMTKEYISLGYAPTINIDATSSLVMRTNNETVIDATSSQVQILSILTILSDQVNVTALNASETSSTSISAESIVVDNISATEISIDFSNIIDDDGKSVQTLFDEVNNDISNIELSIGNINESISSLSDEISGLSSNLAISVDAIKDEIQQVSSDLSNEISSLEQNMIDALDSALNDDIVKNLTIGSCISNVVYAVIELRNALSAMRNSLAS